LKLVKNGPSNTGAHHAIFVESGDRASALPAWHRAFTGDGSPSLAPAPSRPQKVNATVSLDKGKIRSDVKQAKEKIEEEVEKLEGETKAKRRSEGPLFGAVGADQWG